MGKYPTAIYRVSVKALIFNEQGEILLVKERSGRWDIPGGGIDHGEDARTALVRELEEELGVTPKSISDTAITQTIYRPNKELWSLRLVHRVELTDITDAAPGDGVSKIRFVAKDDLDAEKDYEKLIIELLEMH